LLDSIYLFIFSVIVRFRSLRPCVILVGRWQ